MEIDMEAVQIFDARARALQLAGARLERLAGGATWSEGPVWLPQDGALLWSDIPNDRMLCWSAAQGMSVWRTGVEFTNGHALEADGSLLHCSHGRRAIVRTRRHGSRWGEDELVVSHYQERRLNSPNDIVVKRDGTLWFTDPPYGIVSDREGHRADPELRHNYVFRYDPGAGTLEVASDFLDEPNGLAFSPGEDTLYVSDTSAALRDGAHHHVVAFDVVAGRVLARPRVFAVIEPGLPDGLRVDRRGWLFTSSASGVQVFHPDGARMAQIPVPEKVGNLAFGGAAGNELFIAASTSLYRLRLGLAVA
ncbi:SMP-30/gluconolactonase/LRE family protein [Cupriavidus alkaliphilus]|uniref:Gluconolactonase n=1 Tax=Cupriavidus alkaliphilus TaxID=942866 RepID=A0A7W4V5X6_9BURK|nr:SMP-30/gluconolactonase/LRE family protein [Cupriavidus alkaliphilus]MBB3005662.1 gluconolactonase [Cupriavidus alkaliphilus]